MQHIVYDQQNSGSFPVAILIKTNALKYNETKKHYTDYLTNQGVLPSEIVAFNCKYNDAGNAPAGFIKNYLSTLLPALESLNTKYLYVCDAAYFKVLAKVTKAEPYIGYVLPCKIPGFEHMKVVLGINYAQLFYNPTLQTKLDLSLDTLMSDIKGQYTGLGGNIIHSVNYLHEPLTIAAQLNKLHQYDALTCDIETFSLKFWEAGIGTIAFAWDQHNGTAMSIDQGGLDPEVSRAALKQFFIDYKGKLIFHNANFDVKVLIYQLFMDNPLDQEGLLYGLEVFGPKVEDTKIISYLATNTTAGNKLSLKDLAHEFAGNYAQEDITDIKLIPQDELLEYNVVDCLATWYAFNKYKPIMVRDKQLSIYQDVMLPSMIDLFQIELTGMALDMNQVHQTEVDLLALSDKYRDIINTSSIIEDFTAHLQQEECTKMNTLWKRKSETIDYFRYIDYNASSPVQTQKLLYDFLGYEPIDFTKTGQPATGSKTISKLINHTNNSKEKELLQALIDLGDVSKILSTFIKAFKENSFLKDDGIHYLHGSFNLGGTVSGRLSSSAPNLQNIPSGSKYAKHIKKCFIAPPDWIFVGADFASLEDRISALTTKDPNKLKVYTGFAVYELNINGTCHHIREDATVNFDGNSYTGKEFYEKYGNS